MPESKKSLLPRKPVVSVGAQYRNPTYQLNEIDPDVVLQKAGLQRQDLLKLLYDDEIYSCTERRTASVLGNAWTIEGEQPEWLYREIAALHQDIVRACMNAKWLGKSVAELIYQQREDGVFMICQLSPRNPDAFKQTDKGIVWQENSASQVIAVMPEKILYLGNNLHEQNPKGDSVLSRVYWAWFNKHYGEQFWAKFAERHASPITVIKSDLTNANPAEAAQALSELAAAGAQAVSDGSVALHKEDEISFVDANSDGSAHQKYVRHQIQRIQKTLLGRVLTADLEHSSRAAQETDDNFVKDLFNADLSFCEEAVNHVLQALLSVNGISADAVYFTYQRQQIIDPQRWQRDVALLQSGAITFTQQYYLDNYGFEETHFQLREPQSSLQASASLSALPTGAQEIDVLLDAALAVYPQDSEALQLLAEEAQDEADFMARLADYYQHSAVQQSQDWAAQLLAKMAAVGIAHGKQNKY